VHVQEPGNHTPTVEITRPATPQEAFIGETFDIEWTVADEDDDPLHVSLWAYSGDTGWFQVEGAEWLDVEEGAGSFTWDTSSLRHGWYCFSAWVWDGSAQGVVGSPDFMHAMLPPASMPTFTFLTPAPGQQVARGDAFELQWDASIVPGDEGRMKVQLWACHLDAGGNPVWASIAENLDPAAGSYSWDTTGTTASWYSFGAWLGYNDVWVCVGSGNWLQIV
jgi:hypothetical protein